ncbi:hypothetical protein AMK59_3916 [Oryctes borbonicus]|uniref:Cwf19-like C-terminal domain-containing protein n=1 Tax=Oryctes borbonicus TaxID=1629725 RepID=A0A0T6B7J4_9SCAR|nr:hypothetical protein AMK59_3916 [Oryctes borbonicus]
MNAADIVSWLAVQLKPRYHVSGLEGIYYERKPYRITTPDTPMQAVTRFIALARVGNPQKDKWIYAMNLTPIDKMKMNDILQKTTDETECPYNVQELSNTVIPQNQMKRHQYFYDMSTPVDEKEHKKVKRQKIEFDQNKCWFCLASSNVEKHLIITVGNETYLALAKGGIVEEHFLICPVQHHQSSISLAKDVLEEIEQFKEAITKFYARNNSVPVFFERNYKTSHMQLQCIPIPSAAQRELEDIFHDEAESQGIKLIELDSSPLDQIVESKKPYFFLQLPNGKKFCAKIDGSKGFPINFGRDVLAMGPILNMSDRVEWKDCILGKKDEEMLVKRIRTDFEPYDISESI